MICTDPRTGSPLWGEVITAAASCMSGMAGPIAQAGPAKAKKTKTATRENSRLERTANRRTTKLRAIKRLPLGYS
jgi:hypothetical protein